MPEVIATFVERGGEGGLDASCVRGLTPPAIAVSAP